MNTTVPRLRTAFVTLIVIALSAVFAGSSAFAAATPRIVGGTAAATPGWMTQVWSQTLLEEGTCGGELVSSRWVLTAAHCVTNERSGAPLDPSVFHLFIGVPALTEPSSANPGTSVDSVLVDPTYNPQGTMGDVALLHLATAAAAVPVAFAPPGTAVTGAVPDVLGWGVTASGDVSPNLQSVPQPILDPGPCAAKYNRDFVAESMICAGGVLGQDSCNGDSGGPLAFGAQSPVALLAGTVDFGDDQCANGTPAVYQRVTEGSTANWLRSVLKQPVIADSDATPVTGDTETFKASSPWPDAVYRWDLDGNGTYTDATGASVSRTLTGSRTVSVQAVSPSAADSAVTRLTVTPVAAVLTSIGVIRTSRGATAHTHVPGSGSMRIRAAIGNKTLATKTVNVASAGNLTVHLGLSAKQRSRRPEIKLRWTSAYGPTVHADASHRLPA